MENYLDERPQMVLISMRKYIQQGDLDDAQEIIAFRKYVKKIIAKQIFLHWDVERALFPFLK